MRYSSLLAALTLGLTASTQAAYISVDDSDPNTITIKAGDFEIGFYVNGNLLASGLGVHGLITLPDGPHSFDGSWIDLGGTNDAFEIYFDELSNPGAITSGIDGVGSSDGTYGSLSGAIGAYVGTPYLTTTGAFDQNSGTQFGGLPFLSISFTPEATNRVPEGGNSVMLLGLATCILGLVARRIRR